MAAALVTAEQQCPSLDIGSLRSAARRLLADEAELPSEGELETLTLQMRGHLMLAIPVVEALADRFPEDDVPSACAHAAAMEARIRLGLEPRRGLPAQVAHAQRLARSVNALCDHYENLSGGQPVVLDPERAALLDLWNHCIHCETCTTRDGEGVNANLPCAAAERLYGVYRRAAGVSGVRP
ncbi:DUF6415 family natural product biosynthesis protein [Streptomyces sp.]|uniref:DUF6415 family natural product biosynthesis protein n=1 Tax=Streptomyces sp. TaxID=1931 RepID=UPI002D347BEE|nr:DUF6415 family natural product biosynthesis protein [Streptomyces sp.]HZF90691.1 DUF6415 family natural product biosynthesis protein [Streptomyces sp.]